MPDRLWSRSTRAVVRREFLAFVRTRWYVVGTLFGPVLLSLVVALPVLFSEAGGTRRVVVVDRSGADLGRDVAANLAPAGETDRFRVVRVVRPADDAAADSVREALRAEVAAGTIDGTIWLPPAPAAGSPVVYEGENASSPRDLREMRGAVDEAVRRERLRDAGIDPAVLHEILQPVPVEARGAGEEAGPRGAADDLFVLAQFMGMALYLVILLYGNAILRGIREEKENRVVEVVLSSIRPEQLMAGKVFGIGAAGLLQLAVWVGFGAAVLAWGHEIAASFGTTLPALPHVPWSAGLLFLAFFAGGYFLYASIYAALGAVATSGQEAQSLQFPAMLPLFVGFMMIFAVVDDPSGTLAVVGTLVPFTSPLIVPVRAAVAVVPPLELALSAAILAASCWLCLWIGGKVYRVTILATGSRPGARQIWRWIRAG